MILQFFAKIIAEGATIEQKIARAARKLPEDEGEEPKTQVNTKRRTSRKQRGLALENLFDHLAQRIKIF
ncbi:MAG: hypothetical protein ACKVOH_00195 [Chlamydiales bacterium]